MGAMKEMENSGQFKKERRNTLPVVIDKANFEEAIVATGFGKFNIILLFSIIPSSFSQACEQMALSYVLPVAECDLELTLAQKGLLNAVTYAGMISSGPFFGIICDTFGRKKLIIYGYFVHFLCSIAAASSTSVLQMMIAKFFCGFVFNGPFSATTTYLTEFHSSEYRARVQLIRGVTYALGFLLLSGAAWLVLPTAFSITIFGSLNIHSWNLFLLCCACSPLSASILFTFMPESPKFLMSVGRNEDALKVFQSIYSMNSGRPKTDFPVKQLISELKGEDKVKDKSVKEFISKGWARISPVFSPPYIYRLALACTAAMTILTGLHTIKLWVPQILQLANDYQQAHNGSSTNVCGIMSILTENKTGSENETCHVTTENSFVYSNSMIINGVGMGFFIISGFFVNLLGKKNIMRVLTAAASVSAIGLYFAPNSAVLISLFSVYISCLDLTGVMAMTITLEMFPTHFRAIALSFHLMFARVGSLSANLLFSTLVGAGCLTPFLFCCLLTAALPFLITLYPNTENKALM
ncbi:unnamed protein product [Psylliodes chrysocephalus]|uniref:Major facilitator superfamily (MFS) profile domain-containing protein n=1 Tax=Psylliodes chrysocephalus TaxID=3402493 RepID=A0A9P0D4B6_9CUCU|nr:unnamed protein product [Psylliodes chrysocephala]